MSKKILRLVPVLERTGLSRRTLYQEMSAGRFPRPVQLTARSVGWPEDDVEKWILERIEARDAAMA
ncbi:MAG: AlpA family phage regulatory protein [Rhizobiaceae bacterium]|nr:AlpA family phage regulatory protein [Rhizobiaceae bacterium]